MHGVMLSDMNCENESEDKGTLCVAFKRSSFFHSSKSQKPYFVRKYHKTSNHNKKASKEEKNTS